MVCNWYWSPLCKYEGEYSFDDCWCLVVLDFVFRSYHDEYDDNAVDDNGKEDDEASKAGDDDVCIVQ